MSKRRKNSNYKISFEQEKNGISKKGILLIVAIAVLVTALTVGAFIFAFGGDDSDKADTEISLSAPDFTVYDMEGNAVKLSDFVGKPIVLNFWATWCYYCVAEMPEFDEMYKKYGNDVVFLMVNATDNLEETVDAVTDFYNESGYSFPIYFDKNGLACSAYEVSSFPQTIFYTAKGDIFYKQIGAMSGEALEDKIKNILK